MSKDSIPDEEKADVYDAFRDAVNMTPAALETWLKSDQSREVGWANGKNKTAAGGKEAVGHASGRAIVAIMRKKKGELDAEDYAHMSKVVGYVRRHLAQRPAGSIVESRWRFSLMNWGHDPENE